MCVHVYKLKIYAHMNEIIYTHICNIKDDAWIIITINNNSSMALCLGKKLPGASVGLKAEGDSHSPGLAPGINKKREEGGF